LDNDAIAGHQELNQPDQQKIATGLALHTARRTDRIEVAIKIKLQQIGWVVRPLPSPAARSDITKSTLPKIKRRNESLDHSNRIVAGHIILHTRWQKTRLIPAHTGLEGTIRHAESYLPSL